MGSGGDLLSGGPNDDTYYVTEGDTVYEQFNTDGTDTVHTTLSTYTMSIYVENLIFSTSEFYPDGDHTAHGNSAANEITGAGGVDTFYGNNGIDRLYGRGGNDNLNGGYAGDYLYGQEGADTLRGDVGNDWLEGGADNDNLSGGDDNDTLVGGEGKDRLTGGSGADTFRFSSVAESMLSVSTFFVFDTVDTITDFQHGIDKIHLRSIDADPTRAENQDFSILTNPTVYTGDWTGKLWITGGTSSGYTPGGLPGSTVGLPLSLTPVTVYASTDYDREAEFQINFSVGATATASDFIL